MINEYNNSENYPKKISSSEDDEFGGSDASTLTFGKFITFEGGEGCGKSTQSKMLYEHLNEKGVKVLLTREVGGTLEAEKIRDILLHSELLSMTEVLLVMAARFEHLNKLIIPALKQGVWVICDRFIDSTAAYQGKNSDIGIDKIFAMHREITGGLLPDLTFFIDLPPEVALARAKNRGDNNKFENKELEFHGSVHKGFVEISKKFKDRVIKVKAEGLTEAEIHANILSKLVAY
jgi:dTMP kinase